MERRDRSLKALDELNFIDSLDSFEKADRLVLWHEEYLSKESFEDYEFNYEELERLEELFYRNINFLENHKEESRTELVKLRKMQQFLKH